MKTLARIALVLSFALATMVDAVAAEPVGGRCDGCEFALMDRPKSPPSVARIAPVGEPGEPMRITGTVFKPDGTTPAAGIVVYAYHTDAKGAYPKLLGSHNVEIRHGKLRGWATTDAQGRYTFESIRPASYPGTSIPQHVHLHVIEPGIAEAYYLDDIHFTDDPLLDASTRERATNRGGSGIVTPTRGTNDVWQVKRDIVLGRNIPNHPAAR